MSKVDWISALTDEELFNKLKEKGVSTPVTASTRKVLEKKLARLLGLIETSSPMASGIGATEVRDDDDDLDAGGYLRDDNVRRRGRPGNDTFGNSFYMEEVDAKPKSPQKSPLRTTYDARPQVQLRDLRRQELEDIQGDLKAQKEINRNLAGLETGTSSSRTALTVLAILVVIGIFLLISSMTAGESADELMRVPKVKVVPAADHVVPADDL